MEALPKITQEDLAARLARFGIEVTQAQVAKLENGDRPIFDYELVAIAKALRVPIQSLFAENEAKRVKPR